MKKTAGTDKTEIRKLLESMVLPGAGLTFFCWCVTLIWGFDIRGLISFIVGFVYVCICYLYLGNTCERAVKCSVKKAKQMMMICYAIRYAGLFMLCAFGMLSGWLDIVGVLLPQFYPRIILTVKQFRRRKEEIDG